MTPARRSTTPQGWTRTRRGRLNRAKFICVRYLLPTAAAVAIAGLSAWWGA